MEGGALLELEIQRHGETSDWDSEGIGSGGCSGDRQDCERTNKMTHC